MLLLRIGEPARARSAPLCSHGSKSSIHAERGGERDGSGWQRWRRREKETSKTTIAERKQTRKKCGKAKRERRTSEEPKVLDLIKTVCIYL